MSMRGPYQRKRCGFRPLAKNAGFTAVAVIALALGIGMSTSIFSATQHPGQEPAHGTQASAAQSQDIPTPAEKAIIVWKVEDPPWDSRFGTRVAPRIRRGDPRAADLEVAAEKIGYKLTIKSIPSEGFPDTFRDAFLKNEEPDILTTGSYQAIDGITLPSDAPARAAINETIRQELVSVTQSLAALEGPARLMATGGIRGWEFLLPTSTNHEAAKQLALRTPECTASEEFPPLPEDLGTIAAPIVRAYVQGESLQEFEDADRLHTVGPDTNTARTRRLILRAPPESPGRVSEVKDCGFWGSDHLAFVQTAVTYESARTLGRIAVLLILRKQESGWRLLTASTDPISNETFLKQIPRLALLFKKAWTPDSSLIPAQLLLPEEGQYPTPADGERFGDFTWQPSSSTNAVGEIIEFAYDNDARLFIRFASDEGPANEQLSDGELWSAESLWKWRVWSVSDAGSVSFSEVRPFQH
jgi:hypothetical protein